MNDVSVSESEPELVSVSDSEAYGLYGVLISQLLSKNHVSLGSHHTHDFPQRI